jgi:hypothetical protein
MGRNDIGSSSSSNQRHISGTLCCGFFSVHSALISLVSFDLLLLSHSLIFTITNFASGEAKYNESNRGAVNLIPYSFLLPFLICQIIWFSTAVIALISLKLLIPYLQLPYLIASSLFGSLNIWLICRTAQVLSTNDDKDIEWFYIVVIAISNILFILQLLFFYCKCVCFRIMLRKRNTVTSADRKMNIASIDAQFDTYSTRSTVIINDEYYEPPPSP